MIIQERLKELYDYNPLTGVFIRIFDRGGRKKGSVAGSINDEGYTVIYADGKPYKAHRLAWLYMTGDHPCEIDHINHIRDDNKFLNLRNSDPQLNSKNQTMYLNNKSGITGVTWRKDMTKWLSVINVNKKQIYLGVRSAIFEAACLRKSAENRYGFHENHGMK